MFVVVFFLFFFFCWGEREKERERERERDRQTDRQTNRQTDRQTDRDSDKDRQTEPETDRQAERERGTERRGVGVGTDLQRTRDGQTDTTDSHRDRPTQSISSFTFKDTHINSWLKRPLCLY